MAINKRLLVKPPSTGITPSEHFGVMLYEGDGSSSNSINGGKFGAGGYFTGSASQIVLPQLALTSDVSVSMWVNLGSTTSSSSLRLFSLNSVSNGWAGTLRLTYQPSSSAFGIAVGNGQSAETTVLSHTNSLTQGTWYHIVATRDVSTNVTKLYINGSEADSETVSATATIQSNAFSSIGNQVSNYSGTSWEGKIDQTRIFQKVLTSSQVSTLYAETAATVESLDPLNVDTTDTLQVLGDSSCIATYQFENNENDLSGNYNGTGTGIQYTAGRYGQAASFANNSDAKIQLSSKILADNDNLTVSFWIRNMSCGDYGTIIGEGVDSQTSGYNVQINPDDNTIDFFRSAGGSSYVFSGNSYNFGISGSDWVHCCFTVSTTQLKYYKNGINVLTASVSNTSSVTGNYNTSFMWDEKYERYQKGDLDQVRVFHKTLSAAEVTTLYNENPLVASYRFEGNSNDDMRTYNGTDTNVTYEYGLGFTPDFVWIKNRTGSADHHSIIDSSRGTASQIFPNLTNGQNTYTDQLTSFDSGGFTVKGFQSSEHGRLVNVSGNDYAAWCFKANGGTTTTGSGTGGVSSVTNQVNSQAGFSITKWNEGSSSTSTVTHGLSQAPDLVITKKLNSAQSWMVWHEALSGTQYLRLQETNAVATSSNFFTAVPDATSVYLGGYQTESTSNTRIMYAFHSVDGFSKFGSYTGNGSTNGPIVETGFEPAFIMAKQTDDTSNWVIVDNKRSTTNPRDKGLRPNTSDSESTVSNNMVVDFLSNGFQLKQTSGSNANNGNFIYMAFAADPDTEAPTVAKSFGIQTWSGDNSTTRTIDGYGFEPSLVWVKWRTGNYNHAHILYTNLLNNPSANSGLSSSSNGALNSYKLTQFTDDGFQFASPINAVNETNFTFVGWAWKADDNEATIEEVTEDLNAVAVYKFEDNVNDVTSTYNGTATDITYNSSGKFNKSAIFNGSSSKVAVGNWGLTSNRDFSTSFWFKADSLSGDQWLYGQGANAGNFDAHSIYLRNNTTVYHDNRGNSDALTTSLSLSTGTWYHFAYTYNASTGVHTGYINGASIGTTTRTLDLQSNNSGGAIGTREIAGSYHFDGEIDQFRVYQQTLTTTNVATLYAETAAQNNSLSLGMTYVASVQSIVSANSNAGFSIVKYTGTQISGTKIPHGLSAAPDMIIIKRLDGGAGFNWIVGHSSLDFTQNQSLSLDGTGAVATDPYWNATAPSATVFTLGVGSNTGSTNHNGGNYIAYCFHSVAGYSKFGSYTGNGGSNSITGLGFQPDWLMIKRATGGSSNGWVICDSVRGVGVNLRADTNGAEADESAYTTSFDSDGFTLAQAGGNTNVSGSTYIYWAIKIN